MRVPTLINGDIAMSEKVPCFRCYTEKEMIETLIRLKNNREDCKKMGEKARKVVLEKYTYENAAKKFANFFMDIAKEDGYFADNKDITAFVISYGKNPNFTDCVNALKKQTISCKIEIIKDYAPSSVAFQEMINRCKSKYYIQVDEDMVLYPDAVEIMYNAIVNSDQNIAMIAHMLHDEHLNYDIVGVKIYNHDITKKYPYNTDINFNEIPTIDQMSRMEKDGYTSRIFGTVIGVHSPKWNEELIFERYFDLLEKYKIYKYKWIENLPKKLEEIYDKAPTELNYYAMMGPKQV